MIFLFWLSSRLPLSTLQALGGWSGALTAKVSGRYHDRLTVNFRHIYPDITPVMLKEARRPAGRIVFEMPYFWVRKNGADVAPHLSDVCRTVVERALADGCDLVFLMPYLDCSEIPPQTCACEHPVISLFKPPHRTSLRGWIETIRAGPDMQMTSADPRGMCILVHALKRGETVDILSDQTPTVGKGVWVPFFGKFAYTMTLVHRLHRLMGVPVVVLFVERLPRDADCRLHLEEIGDLPEDAAQAATHINAAVEQLITMAST